MTSVRRSSIETQAVNLLIQSGWSGRIPVPVEDVAGFSGAVIRYQPFEADDVSGLLLREEDAPAVIGVNSANARVRQRFTIAHEVGHLKLHEGKRLILDRLVRVNFRDAVSSTATDRQEREANAFAAALLMPDEAVAGSLSKLAQGRERSDTAIVQNLARTFDVSRQAMEYRLMNLGFLTPG
ncbi:ImmA/IrrE family metallo-endopeptidase [Pseudofrankia sp. BMG5.37]|uniref:ImmA/IrrE family metallo-endopeptidase n=1 Tax=Pseudofrankia sp. BMG5.37 TaxID=3050035 RepID=UPI002894DBD8|nr:ImmA/IrrE family metallo-endopeptidase [Pseudofrankia sp. BMG5.37]MDT3438262.1 ImmA/IrrE family metallo-endopeptidase [Pseudofrankia sp. BMG5.37]